MLIYVRDAERSSDEGLSFNKWLDSLGSIGILLNGRKISRIDRQGLENV